MTIYQYLAANCSLCRNILKLEIVYSVSEEPFHRRPNGAHGFVICLHLSSQNCISEWALEVHSQKDKPDHRIYIEAVQLAKGHMG